MEVKFHGDIGMVVALTLVFGVRAVRSVRLVDEVGEAVTLPAFLLVQHLPVANSKSETSCSMTNQSNRAL